MVPADEEDNYIEAMELFSEMAEAASNTKDRVDMFIERSRKQVEVAKDSLGSAIKILGIQA
jgi:predicted RecB family endonuclease